MNTKKIWWGLTIAGVTGIILLSVVWNGWLTPVQNIPKSIEIAVLTIPLLFFVRGVFNQKRDTFIGLSLLSFAYILIGIWYAFSIEERLYGYAMLILGLCVFFGAYLYVRKHDKEEIRKKDSIRAVE